MRSAGSVRHLKPIIPSCVYRHAVASLGLLAFSIASVSWPQGYSHHVAADWNFAAKGSTLGWTPIVPLNSFGFQKGALTFTATSEAVIVFSSAITVPAEPMQLVEVVMSSNTAGPAKVFWAPSPSVKSSSTGFTGFQGGDENDFLMVGDGVFHHYYLPIATAPGSTIYRLRMDVPPNATVSIQSVDLANLAAPTGSGVDPDWKFTAAGDALGWIPYNGVVDMSVSGGSLHLQTFANTTLLGPNAEISNQLEWFSLFGKVSHATLERPWVQFNFVGKVDSTTETNAFIPVVADAVEHVYNQNVGGMGNWWSGVSQISLTVAENTSIAISQMQVSSDPQGPADLAVDSFGPATPLIRAGSPFQVSCHVWDRGAEEVEKLGVKLNLPADGSVRVIASPTVPASLTHGYPQTLTWTLKASRSGSFPIAVAATSQSGVAQAANTLLVNPAVQARASTYVPKPVPVKTNYDIGLYYFPGWSLYSHWDPIRSFPERMPALGYYAEGAPQVLDWQIKWAVEHGISFFAVDWYWFGSGQAAPPGEQPNNFLEAYSAAVYRSYIKFCIAYANDHAGDTAGSVDEFQKIAQAWIHEYFLRAGYYEIDKSPVVFVLNPSQLDLNLGGSAKVALDSARQLAKDAGYKGIYFVAGTDGNPAQVTQLEADGYDALSTYSYGAFGAFDPDQAPYSEMVTSYENFWDALTTAGALPYWTPTGTDWDPRPDQVPQYGGGYTFVRTGSTPALYQTMLQAAKDRIDAAKSPPIVMADAWNERGEGHWTEPSAGFGFGYLDAIRNVFAGTSPHTDLVPSDVGLPTVESQPSTSFWTFTSTSDLQPWQVSPGPPFFNWSVNLSNSQIKAGDWTFTSNGNADLIRQGFELSAQQYSAIAVTLSVSADAWVTLSWGADDEPGPSALRNAGFAAAAGPMQTYIVPVANLPGWRGNINLLRLNFSSPQDVNVGLQSIQFVPSSTTKAIATNQVQLEFRATAGSAAPAAQTLSVASATGSSMSWTATAQKLAWLRLSRVKGLAPFNVTVSVNPAGLAVGVYKAAIEISADGAGNSPLTVPVTLWVMPPP